MGLIKTSRRQFLATGAGATVLPAWAIGGHPHALKGLTPVSGDLFNLNITEAQLSVDGRLGHSVLVNGHLPAPLLRWREGNDLTIRVTNYLQEDSSIHWHGILLPYQMDGVPGLSFPGISPGETFTYRFPLRQAGTYWYHSHSGLQEQQGHYGPIIIDPADGSIEADREYVIVLSDWTFEHPHRLFARLKKHSDVYNRQQRTAAEFFKDARAIGLQETLSDRAMWGNMRMNPTDLSDVTAATYTYLINGHSPLENWQGLFRSGERIRLRFINASAMTIFNVRLPDLPMTVIQSDGLDVQPVETDEIQIGVAETFDALVKPNRASHTIIAESNDRSGLARGTLTTTPLGPTPIPALRKRPLLTMKDMAMAHEAGAHHHAHHHSGGSQEHNHPTGPGVVGLAQNPVNRLSERPLGLEDEPHRVLVYTDLRAREPNPDSRAPERTVELHLTSNMERYMWSFDGRKFSEVREPISFREGERVRMTLVNDTMMPHPIHLHGMFFELVTGEHDHKPRKHTVVVKPGEKMSIDITADAVGEWAFHCHLLYHMHAGMMRVVSVEGTT